MKFMIQTHKVSRYKSIDMKFEWIINLLTNLRMQPETKENTEHKQPQRLTMNLQQQGNTVSALPQFITRASHPIVAGLHILTKIGLVFIYLILPFVTSPFNALVAVVMGSSIDFWLVKNLSGRCLVGLRWWVDFSEDGEQQWRFECRVNQNGVSLANQRAFWWTLVIFGIIWLGLTIINVLKFDVAQISICIFCFTLLFFNVFCFYKCGKVQKEYVTRLFDTYEVSKVAKYMGGSIISSFR